MDNDIVTSRIMAIGERHGVRCSTEEFYAALNQLFHEFESEVYDEIHAHMWQSLPLQFRLLVDDCVRTHREMPDTIRLLDVGCGTGLATDSLLCTALGSRIKSVDLLDVSSAMLTLAARRVVRHGITPNVIHGTLESLPPGSHYDLVVTCSVLHHIADLPGFLRSIGTLQCPGGIFMHVHDQNSDHLEDPELRARTALAPQPLVPAWARRLSPHRIVSGFRRRLIGPGAHDYVLKTNHALLKKGIITTPLTADEVFSITDIQNFTAERGISMAKLKVWTSGYDCIAHRSYGFFGALWSALPNQLQHSEEKLIQQHALNGTKLGAAWRRV